MINKYITGYNSGEWRLTLTEHCDLHTTAKSQSFNKSQLLFAFPPPLPLYPTTISLSPNAGWKKKKKKLKTIKDRTPKLSSSAAQRRLQFWQSNILFLWSHGKWVKRVHSTSRAAGQGSCATGILRPLSSKPCFRMCLPSGRFLAPIWFSVHLVSPTHETKYVRLMLGLCTDGNKNKLGREQLVNPSANPTPYLWKPHTLPPNIS